VRNWKKVCYFAGGVIYASGDLRKLVVNGNQIATYKICDMNMHESETTDIRRNRRGR